VKVALKNLNCGTVIRVNCLFDFVEQEIKQLDLGDRLGRYFAAGSWSEWLDLNTKFEVVREELTTPEKIELAKELELWVHDFLDTKGRLPSAEEFQKAADNVTSNIIHDPARAA
jgi:hypothetical protein